MRKIKEIIYHYRDVAFILAVFIALFIGGCLIYTASKSKPDNSINESMASVENGIHRAERGAGTAQTEIKNAEKHIQRANEATGKLTERTKRDAEELDECQRITDRMSERSKRIQRIVADVEGANKTDGT